MFSECSNYLQSGGKKVECKSIRIHDNATADVAGFVALPITKYAEVGDTQKTPLTSEKILTSVCGGDV
jgi:hypothetical protein